ncbi:hypothetical protein AALB16_03960 [Lachnospiraceae bacterium 62-35]
MISELFGLASTSDMWIFAKSWALKEDYDYMQCTGDFSDVNPAYCSIENIKTDKEKDLQ